MKKFISLILLIVYSALLTVPYIPYVVFFTGKILHNEQVSIGVDNPETIIGDICYLNAIIKRANNEKTSDNTDVPPPPVMETSGMVYINSESLFSLNIVIPVKIDFKGYMISFKEAFLEVGVPPPKSISLA